MNVFNIQLQLVNSTQCLWVLASRWDVWVFRCMSFQPKRQATWKRRTLQSLWNQRKREKENMWQAQVEHGSFTPLVISATGGMSRESKKFFSCLAEMICKKRETTYNVTITWIGRKAAFSLIKSIWICFGGSRSVFQNEKLEMS